MAREKRKKATRKSPRTLLIATNGQLTEQFYLKEMVQRLRGEQVRAAVQFVNGDPTTMLRDLRRPRGGRTGSTKSGWCSTRTRWTAAPLSPSAGRSAPPRRSGMPWSPGPVSKRGWWPITSRSGDTGIPGTLSGTWHPSSRRELRPKHCPVTSRIKPSTKRSSDAVSRGTTSRSEMPCPHLPDPGCPTSFGHSAERADHAADRS